MPKHHNDFLNEFLGRIFNFKGEAISPEVSESIQPVYDVKGTGEIRIIADALLNNSDKSFTVPAGKKWEILYGTVRLTTTATVGNRLMVFQILDPAANILWNSLALNVHTASTFEEYLIQPGQNESRETVATNHEMPMPDRTILSSGFVFRVVDGSVIDAAADDMIVRFVVRETSDEEA